MFKKILIANRGEIAIRIIRTCKEMGIQTVAVYSEADADAMHVSLADEAVCIGKAPAGDSYLNMPSILSAAVVTGAQAIHPGFGFLSENSKFARLCREMNIIFIGPDADVIDQMGDKQHARETMKAAQVPVIPGSEDFVHSAEEALAIAEEVGYPVLFKATAGGGGKGMRLVKDEGQLQAAFDEARLEAQQNFHNDQLYLEKVIHPAHHIEVQILGDNYGKVIHLGERECSLQRNHQKVLEESPSPFIRPEIREKICAAAVQAGKEVHYTGAGTIEFLVDSEQNFYFMEMNTRIQVEHPITEMVTGVDLVKKQIEIAAGQALDLDQEDISFKGHAIEVRLNAERPENHFYPSTGSFDFVHFPAGNLGLRLESAVYNGYQMPPYYDNMFAKLIAYGADREEAVQRMKRALAELRIEGIASNQALLQAILADEGFLSGDYSNDYLEASLLPAWLAQESK
ncbi:acetyl-CoA carboxylase biotin carboxylase subunit [Aerococcus sp. UMB8608]|uniref:acetyl-CoA carboxylase biotin carboxylase subunit n=1 Tax=Aerococcus sp. UMB8608 TaxID=3046347 RepID=UPI00254B2620|nr:acetyl-CoA carboxylase biotin carboxylase subunit [Aerococcus sp. UMB8608]MDK6679308.1 acetyl-CoA carboxylase biotin carboxylase subunit [Aerococcus sp. UMB8608]